MTPAAPTLGEIYADRCSLDAYCETCRRLTPIDVAKVIRKHGLAKPVDQLTFRCSRCHEAGRPTVKAPGNATLGFRRVWPPLDG